MKNEKTIAIAGNPNCGKSTLFNGLTGSTQKIGNWPGVTVEKKEGILNLEGDKINIVDLPGIYSLSALSEDEKVARDFILSKEPSMVVNIVDATNLERNLYLTSQIIEMRVPMIVLVNRMDLAEKMNISINAEHLSKHLGCPVIAISAINRADIMKTIQAIGEALKEPVMPEFSISYANEIEEAVARMTSRLETAAEETGTDSRWVALKLIEGDQWIKNKVLKSGVISENEIKQEVEKIESLLGESGDILIADQRYGFIHGLTRDVIEKKINKRRLSEKIDRIALNRFLGIPVFLGIMYLLFWFTIVVGGSFIDFFDVLFGTIFVDGFGNLLESAGAPQWIISILAGGIGAGIQTVATFIPIIFSMFFMLSLLEDSGYMARAAFVMDRAMMTIGLPGKSFIPMLVGFGCTVPAIMATRTLETKKDRMLTIFMTPFMSCGARLPVYVLFAAAFFPERSGIMVFSLYITGILLAVMTGYLLKNTLFKGEPSHFVMELPPYNAPRMKHIMIHTWNRLKQFMFRAGKVIVIVVMVLSFLNSLGTDGSFGNEDGEKSVLSKIGKTITPVFEPMGIEKDNWPASVSIFTGIFAKEAVVGTLSSLYSQIDVAKSSEPSAESPEEAAEEFNFVAGLEEAFATIPENLSGIFGGLSDPLGTGIVAESADREAIAGELEIETGIFTRMQERFPHGPMQAYAFLLFILIYFPCVAALGAVVRETGMKIALLQVGYLTVLGWVAAVLFYQVTVAHELLWILVAAGLFAVMALGFYLMGKKNPYHLSDREAQ
ncbi:MAG TPA: Fe(2+) transporter permease subunit FeoB [Spirochaetota bacterium]|nr:Fe(2+) transporter permease subunit FeoB [Spirochaetota bacterium]HPI87862.1 Fe(2+) transporter permease subunit FeoB [Spirochaetota bacterium]HPR47406.1 Fe(2+) transporter permease subunit FeoB [Spirochaetota bacterium]